LILISGPLGTGKTHLALSLRFLVEDKLGGYLITGRDSSRRCDGEGGTSAEPYPAFVSALEELVGLVMRRGPSEVQRIREAVRRSVGIESFVLTRFLPSLGAILDDNDDCGGAETEEGCRAIEESHRPPPSSDAVLHFMYVLGIFFRAISSRERPLVLLLDDLHELDSCSLNVLGTVLASTDPGGGSSSDENGGFLVVGTIQPDKAPGGSALASKLCEIEDSTSAISHFSLGNRDETELCDILSQLLTVTPFEARPLAVLVHQRTAGNPVHVIEMLSFLRERDLIVPDLDSGVWSWDTPEISNSIDAAPTLEDLVLIKLSRLSLECQELLKVASCIGSKLDEDIIGYILGQSVHQSVLEAETANLLYLERGGLRAESCYRFRSSCIQRAAYSLIPSETRESFHLEIGRKVWRCLDEESTEKYVFTVLSQFSKGRSLIQSPKECSAVASLCYNAGFKAAQASSFRVASEYFNLGLALLGSNCWRENYELTLLLCNAASEMDMCSGNFSAMEDRLNHVLKHARLFKDTVQARATKIYYYGMSDAHQSDAVNEGIAVLNQLGTWMPSKVNKFRLWLELMGIKRVLRGRTDNSILRMPALVDPEKRSCLQILSLVYQNAIFSRPDLVPFVILRMINITVKHGLNEFASVAFTNYGRLCIEAFDDVEMGYRYGSLGLAILERFKANELVPRVYATFYKHIYVHKKPLKATLQPLAKAYRIGLYTGDLDAGFLCAIYFCLSSFDAGVPLPVIEREYADIIRRMEITRQKSMMTTALPLAQCMRDLMGLSGEGDLINYDELLIGSQVAGRPLIVSAVLACRMIIAHVYDEYDFVSETIGAFVERYLNIIPRGSSRFGMTVTVGMCAIKLARLGKDQRCNLRIAKAMVKRLRVYARYNPSDCLGKLHLVQAELASFQNDPRRAEQKYLSAIALAGAAEARYVWAKANESMARHILTCCNENLERKQDARDFFVEARRVYKEWGAIVKVAKMDEEAQLIFPELEAATQQRTKSRPSLRICTSMESMFPLPYDSRNC
jgi:predicted ATPase